MDPSLEPFLRRQPKRLVCEHTHTLPDGCSCLALAGDAPLLAAGGWEAIAVLSPQLQLLATLAGHAGGTTSLCWGRGGVLVSAGEDGAAAIWSCSSSEDGSMAGACLARLQCEGVNADKTPDGHTVCCATVNAAGTLAAAAAGRTLHVVELAGPDYEASRRVYPPVAGGVIEDVKFVGDDRLLLAYYGGVTLFSTQPGTAGMVFEHGTNVMSVDATPDLRCIVGGCMDECVHIWHLSQPGKDGAAGAAQGAEGDDDDDDDDDAATELVEYSCGGYQGKVTRVSFNADHTALASTGGTQSTIWDTFSGDGPAGSVPVLALGHTKAVCCQAWQPLPGSSLLATAGRDGRVLCYDTAEFAPPDEEGMPKFAAPIAAAPDPQPDEAAALAWSAADTQLIYVAHVSGAVRCWRLPGNEDPAAADEA